MKGLILAGLIVSLGACSMPWDDGRIMFMADAEGMRAFSDYQNGLKSQDDSFFKLRALQEQEKTKRVCKSCGFLGRLMGGSAGTIPAKGNLTEDRK